ncbi:MAG TPA: rhamnulokinase family protein, partial [Pyrinomonadaceae bacterium]|nr:rhamnulokinase family protein [Pyrinomonadaceae bacterium]
AVDLGAGSGRVCLAGVARGEFLLEEVRRFRYPATLSHGHLRWNLSQIFSEIKCGLREAGERARQLGRPIRSLGVDSWGVDYGLIDAGGDLIEEPICYRDEGTQGVMEQVFAQLPRAEIFARTGIQFLVFNTLFQLYTHTQNGDLKSAARLLLIPDLINFFLTGEQVTEYSNATTTQMLNARSKEWDWEMIDSLGLPGKLLAKVVTTGFDLGPLKPALIDELGLEGVRVITPATHDTGSAVAGAPLRDGWAYISSGTWSLVGVERDSVLINPEVERLNFTNEGGAFGKIRFLKNVMGLWILESCRREWNESGFEVDYDNLLTQVRMISDSGSQIFPDDPRFLNPQGMLAAIAEQLAEQGEPMPAEPPAIAKLILDSLALRYASVLRTIEKLTKQKVEGVQIVGGGSQNDYLNQATANATGLPVVAGPVEATVTGNVLVQAIASGRFASHVEARRHVADNVQFKEFTPRPSPEWDEAARRYAEMESEVSNQQTVISSQQTVVSS